MSIRRCALLLGLLLATACTSPRGEVADSADDAPAPTPTAASGPVDTRAGLDAGQPLDDLGGLHFESARVRETGAGWIRLNMRLGSHSSPADPAWQAAYDELVDDALANGLQVYALVGDEAVPGDAPVGSDSWLDEYAAAFVTIVGHFKDRVRVYETFNEPNNWVAPDTPALSPDRFATVMERLYLETKVYSGHADDPAWQVTIVSGGLFSFDLSDGSDYLAATWQSGRNAAAWDSMCNELGTYPMDGYGYHVYVREDPDASAEEVRDALRANVDGLLAAATAEEAACGGVTKPVWLSEVGWNAEFTGEEVQARNVGAFFDAFRDDPRIALYTYFTLDDFPEGPYGLFRADGTPRPSYEAFREAAAHSAAR